MQAKVELWKHRVGKRFSVAGEMSTQRPEPANWGQTVKGLPTSCTVGLAQEIFQGELQNQMVLRTDHSGNPGKNQGPSNQLRGCCL